jgi:hypothetical protein
MIIDDGTTRCCRHGKNLTYNSYWTVGGRLALIEFFGVAPYRRYVAGPSQTYYCLATNLLLGPN